MKSSNETGPGTGREFMERTKYRYLGKSDQQKGLPQPPLELPVDPERPIIDLPPPATVDIPTLDLREAIESRQSIRNYVHEPLAPDELSFLLWCTQGVKTRSGIQATFRTVPSAGARHAFETFLLVNDVETLEPGLYRYLALTHRLQQIDTDPTVAHRVTSACFDQQFILRSGVTFLWTAVPYRMTWRYGERGYRDLHLDCGHVCQNLYLAAEAVECGVCAIAAFDDDAMNEILGINGNDQFLIYLATVGKKSELDDRPN
ncbi:SagB/ThcOx family dehydrogenase [Methanoregula sp.]|uniref:SagB/ThcOx family dehydrogenase n=1 Tax=Methanoregula sp. TaxID=2052170 RepID=UPI002371BD4D|nr:SagB/ThcOx family dehydrogenase [Methanoregula sp.]MDD1687401.1 SagB/ThcOx family dehydrogenase [Methanoregula sp.]